MKLTAKRVAKLLKRPGRYPDGDNLYLQVSRPGKASWLLRYERDARERMLGLGAIGTISLGEARERAKAARQQLLDNVDPIDRKRAQRAERALEAAKAMTFAQAAQAYYDRHEKTWKNAKHRAQFLSTLEMYVYPKIGNLPVGEIDTGLVLKCIEPIWSDKTETASRVRGRIENVLGWATVRGYRKGDNPARWRRHLSEVLPMRGKVTKVEHHSALSYGEIAGFIMDLRARDGVAAKALEFAILTAARTSEVIGACWDEIDLQAKTWTIPAGRMKASRLHKVPLCDRAIEILSEVPTEDDNDHVFIGPSNGAGLSNMAMPTVLRRMKRNDVTVHGFRSSFRDWAAETTNFPNHVVEQALAHVIGDKVEAAYRRGDLFTKRKALMDAWAAFCAKPAVNGDVIPMRRGRR
jgi:integrase